MWLPVGLACSWQRCNSVFAFSSGERDRNKKGILLCNDCNVGSYPLDLSNSECQSPIFPSDKLTMGPIKSAQQLQWFTGTECSFRTEHILSFHFLEHHVPLTILKIFTECRMSSGHIAGAAACQSVIDRRGSPSHAAWQNRKSDRPTWLLSSMQEACAFSCMCWIAWAMRPIEMYTLYAKSTSWFKAGQCLTEQLQKRKYSAYLHWPSL